MGAFAGFEHGHRMGDGDGGPEDADRKASSRMGAGKRHNKTKHGPALRCAHGGQLLSAAA